MAAILIVDDDDSFRRMLRITLGRLGHSVTEARNGKEGLSALGHATPDLMILDLVMPEKEGFEVLKEIRSRIPPVKVLAISGGSRIGTADNLHMAKLMGAAKVLAKPFSDGVLLATINGLLESGTETTPKKGE